WNETPRELSAQIAAMRAVRRGAAVSKTARFHVTRRKIENPEIPKSKIQKWCSREDSNLHGFPHTVLSRTRLPIPPREHFGEPQSKTAKRFVNWKKPSSWLAWICVGSL